MKRVHAVVLGGVVVDLTLQSTVNCAADMPGTSSPAVVAARALGGVGRNFAEAFARLDNSVTLYSYVGNDDDGRFARAALGELSRQLPTLVAVLKECTEQPTARYIAVLGNDGELSVGIALMTIFEAMMDPAWALQALRSSSSSSSSPRVDLLMMDANLPCAALRAVLIAADDASRPSWVALDPVSTAKMRGTVWPALRDLTRRRRADSLSDIKGLVLKPNRSELFTLFHLITGRRVHDDPDTTSLTAAVAAEVMSKLPMCSVLLTTLGSAGVCAAVRLDAAWSAPSPLPSPWSMIDAAADGTDHCCRIAVGMFPAAPLRPAERLEKVTGAGDTFFACVMHRLCAATLPPNNGMFQSVAASLGAVADAVRWGTLGAKLALTTPHRASSTAIPTELSRDYLNREFRKLSLATVSPGGSKL